MTLVWLALWACGEPAPAVGHWVARVGDTPVSETVLYADGTLVVRHGSGRVERGRVDPGDDVLRAVELPTWVRQRAAGVYPVRWGAAGAREDVVLTWQGDVARVEVAGGSWHVDGEVLTGTLGPVRVAPGSSEKLTDLAVAMSLPAPMPPERVPRALWQTPAPPPPAPGQQLDEQGRVEVRPPLRLEVAEAARTRVDALLLRSREVAWTVDVAPTAPEVTWQRRRGGCLSQAMLLTKWLQEVGLESRVVTGLLWRAEEHAGRLAWHAWVEVDTGEPAGWVGVDPSAAAWTDGRWLRLGLHRPDRTDPWMQPMSDQGWAVEAGG